MARNIFSVGGGNVYATGCPKYRWMDYSRNLSMRPIKSGKQLVHVIWRDSNGTPGWHQYKDAMDMADSEIRCESVGFLLGITDDRVMLAMSGAIEGDLAGELLHIPLECVVQVRSLSMGKSIQIRRNNK